MTTPSLIFIDELDAIVGKRGSGDSDVVQERILSTLLNEMDGIESLDQVLVLAATNRKDAIDPALLRPGRFDQLIEVTLPEHDCRLAILKTVTRAMPLDSDIDFNLLAKMTHGYSGAELKNLAQEAALCAIRHGRSSICMADLGDLLQV